MKSFFVPTYLMSKTIKKYFDSYYILLFLP